MKETRSFAGSLKTFIPHDTVPDLDSLPVNIEEKAGTAQPGDQTPKGSAMSLVS